MGIDMSICRENGHPTMIQPAETIEMAELGGCGAVISVDPSTRFSTGSAGFLF